MIYRLRVLWALLTGGLPPRCSGCGRYIVGLAVSTGVDGGQQVQRCYPRCRATVRPE